MDPAATSLVSRAKTALHSAAAKAEKVLTDIKSDLKSDRDGRKELREKMENPVADPASKSVQEESMERDNAGGEDDTCISGLATIPSTAAVKQLAMAVERGATYNSIKDLLASSRGSSIVGERASMSFSVVKSIVLREKDKSTSENNRDENQPLVSRLFNSEEHISRSISASHSADYLPKDIRAAPPGSFLVALAEIIGNLKSLHKMASFWLCVVTEIRRFWSEKQPIPHIPLDERPDLNSCLLHQQLQVINCCIARKQRRAIAIEALESLIDQTSSSNTESVELSNNLLSPVIYARTQTGEYVLRLGTDQLSENLVMLETGEPIYSPVTQEEPVLTEELIRETEEFVLRTGSVGAGCSQLLSDMQAFKAANPGCILEDFIRWHSPPDWTETEDEADELSDSDSISKRGRLSRRMQKEGNLWRKLWETAKALPAVKQTPLFDEDLAVDGIFNTLDDISPSELFEQLFVSMIFSSFMIAEAALPIDDNLSKLFQECKDYAFITCQCGISTDKLNDLCKVYETVEMILMNPEEAAELTKQSEETNSGERKSLFKKLGLNFTGKDRQSSDKPTAKEQKKSDEKGVNVFSNLFDGKKSLFSKKNRRSDVPPPPEQSCPVENDWTVV